jgi:hypothetical protein
LQICLIYKNSSIIVSIHDGLGFHFFLINYARHTWRKSALFSCILFLKNFRTVSSKFFVMLLMVQWCNSAGFVTRCLMIPQLNRIDGLVEYAKVMHLKNKSITKFGKSVTQFVTRHFGVFTYLNWITNSTTAVQSNIVGQHLKFKLKPYCTVFEFLGPHLRFGLRSTTLFFDSQCLSVWLRR